jgi:hypothetical protein
MHAGRVRYKAPVSFVVNASRVHSDAVEYRISGIGFGDSFLLGF